MDVELASGEIISDVPDDITKEDLRQKLLSNGYTDEQMGFQAAEQPAQLPPQEAAAPSSTPMDVGAAPMGMSSEGALPSPSAAHSMPTVPQQGMGQPPIQDPTSVPALENSVYERFKSAVSGYVSDTDEGLTRLESGGRGMFGSALKTISSAVRGAATEFDKQMIAGSQEKLKYMDWLESGGEGKYKPTDMNAWSAMRADPAHLYWDRKTPEERAQIRSDLEGSIKAADPRNNWLYRGTEEFDAKVDDWLRTSPEFQEEFVAGKLPQGMGSMLGFMMTSYLGGPAATAATGGAVQADSGFIDALQEGTDLETALKSHDMNFAIGMTEAVPIARMFDRIGAKEPGVKKALTDMLKSGTEEAIQESFTQLMSNAVASDLLSYDPDRKIWEGTEEGASVGFTTGALVDFLGSIVSGGRRRSAKKQVEKEAEAQMDAAFDAAPTAEQEAMAALSPKQAQLEVVGPEGSVTYNDQREIVGPEDQNVPQPTMEAEEVVLESKINPETGEPISDKVEPAAEPAPAPVDEDYTEQVLSPKEATESLKKRETREILKEIAEQDVERVTAPVRDEDKDLRTLVAELGGMNREEAEREGVDPAQFKTEKSGNKWLYPREGGMTMDDLAEKMVEHGFLQEVDAEQARQAWERVTMEESVYTPEGEMRAAEMDQEFLNKVGHDPKAVRRAIYKHLGGQKLSKKEYEVLTDVVAHIPIRGSAIDVDERTAYDAEFGESPGEAGVEATKAPRFSKKVPHETSGKVPSEKGAKGRITEGVRFSQKGEKDAVQKQADGARAILGNVWETTGLKIPRGISESTGRKLESEERWAYSPVQTNVFIKSEEAELDADQGRQEQESLVAAAKKEGVYFEPDGELFDFLETGQKTGGMEHSAWIVGEGDKKVVVRETKETERGSKFGHTSKHSPAKYIRRNRDYNQLFPELQLDVLGVSQDENGNPTILTVQPYVDADKFEKTADLEAALNDKGWYRTGVVNEANRDKPARYEHKASGAIINDVTTDNILQRDGVLYPIDVYVEKMPDPAVAAPRMAKRANPKKATRKKQATKIGKMSDLKGQQKPNFSWFVSAIHSIPALKGNVRVVQKVDNLPAVLRDAIKEAKASDPGLRVPGIYYKDKAYVIYEDATNLEDGIKAAVHETIGHKGVRQVLGAQATSVFEQVAKSKSKPLQALRKEIEKNYADQIKKNPSTAEALIGDEMIAHYMERKGKRPGVIKWAIAQIRSMLRNTFGADINWTEGDLALLFQKSSDNLQGKKTVPAGLEALLINPRYMVAFHGTPHQFDRFSLDAIGTGEGAQAYGWGLYFAGRKSVAEWYRDNLAEERSFTRELNPEIFTYAISETEPTTTEEADVLIDDFVESSRGWLKEQIRLDEIPKNSLENFEKWAVDIKRSSKLKQAAIDGDLDMVGQLLEFHAAKYAKSGNLYQVDIPEDSELLDYDKPLSEQPDGVKSKIKGADWSGLSRGNRPARAKEAILFDHSGRAILEALQMDMWDKHGDRSVAEREASLYLNSLGIPGLRYLDGVSRNRPYKDVVREFRKELPDDADIADVEELIGTGAFSDKNEAVLKALSENDWLGFDYPAQAISAAFKPMASSSFDMSDSLTQSISDALDGGTRNYVIWDESVVTVEAVNDEMVQAEDASRFSRVVSINNQDNKALAIGRLYDFFNRTNQVSAETKFIDLVDEYRSAPLDQKDIDAAFTDARFANSLFDTLRQAYLLAAMKVANPDTIPAKKFSALYDAIYNSPGMTDSTRKLLDDVLVGDDAILSEWGSAKEASYQQSISGADNADADSARFSKKPTRARDVIATDKPVGMYGGLNKKQISAINRFLKQNPDGEDIRTNLKRLKGTPWSSQALDQMLVNLAIEDMLAGREVDYDTVIADSSSLHDIKTQGEKAIWSYLTKNNMLGTPAKPGIALNGAMYNCSPTKGCATVCYAAKGQYQYPSVIQGAAVREWAVKNDPAKVARLAAAEFRKYSESHVVGADKALRLFDQGDASNTGHYVELIKELNKQGVRVHVFSKKPEFLRGVPKFNLRLLSADNTSRQIVRDNPDLDVAFVYEGGKDVPFLEEVGDRVQVILPVKQGSKVLPKVETDKIPSNQKKNICPVDLGKTKKFGTGKGEFYCGKCDKNGGVGCYLGKTTAKALDLLANNPDENTIQRRMKEITNEIRSLPENQQADVYQQLDQVLSEIRRGIDIGSTEGTVAGIEEKTDQEGLDSDQVRLSRKSLDMSHEARMERAEEQGYDTSQVWRHGTALPPGVEIEAFYEGRPVYLTSSPDAAEFFADMKLEDRYEFSEDPDADFEREVMEVFAKKGRVKNLPADFDYGGYFPDSEISKAKEEGYDYIAFEDVLVALDPSQLRSVDAAFDPAQADSPQIMFSRKPSGVVKKPRLFIVTDNGSRAEVSGLKDAREKWVKLRDVVGIETGLGGVSNIGNGLKVYNEDGKEVAHISYNGRIWPPGGYSAGVKTLTQEDIAAIESGVESKAAEDSGQIPLFSMKRDSGFSVMDESRTDAVLRLFQDKMRRVKRIQKNIRDAGKQISEEADVYTGEELFHGKVGEDFEQVERDFLDPIIKLMSKAKVSQDMLDTYLLAKHAPERNARIAELRDDMPDQGSGMKTQEAKRLVKQMESGPKGKALMEIARLVYAMNSYKLDLRQAQGLMDSDMYDEYKDGYQFYVPLKGMAYNEEAKARPRTGKGFSIQGKEDKAAKGRMSPPESPFNHLVADTLETIVRGRKNEVGNKLLNLVNEHPNPDLWEVFTAERPDKKSGIVDRRAKSQRMSAHEMKSASDNTGRPQYFVTKKDGKEYFIKIKDPRMMDAMMNLGVDSSFALTQVFGSLTRYLSMTLTSLNPEFVISNFARDIQTAVYNVMAEQTGAEGKLLGKKLASKIVKDTPKSVAAVMRGEFDRPKDKKFDQYYKEFKEAGAKTGWFHAKGVDQIKGDMVKRLNMEKKNPMGLTKKGLHNTLKVIENINTAIENGVRLSTYVHARDAGLSKQQAASLSKNLTVNFNRKGEWGAGMNALYMFFNASVQGTAQLARTIGMPAKTAGGRMRPNNAQIAMGAMVAGGMIWSEVMRAISDISGEDDEYYDEIPDYVKERNLVIMDWRDGHREKGEYWTIPLPYGYSAFFSAGVIMDTVMEGSMSAAEGAWGIINSILGSFSPIGLSGSDEPAKAVMKSASPTFLKPVVELGTNENFFGSPIYRKNWPGQVPLPDSSMAMKRTAEAWKYVAEAINKATGGDEYVSGDLDWSPDSLEHLFEFGTGGVGKFVNRSYTTAEKLAAGETPEVRGVPFVRRVRGEPSDFEGQSRYYARRDKVMQRAKAYEAYLDEDPKKAELYYKKYEDQIELGIMAKDLEKDLRKVRKDMRDAEIEGDEDAVESLKLEKDALFDTFNSEFNRRLRSKR